MAITIKEIAKQLNLSRNTVSKVLNGGKVPQKTKDLVLNKVKELNYKSSFINDNKKYRILLISAKPLNNINYFISLISSIENYCFDNQYDLFQYTFNNKTNDFERFKNYVKELNIDGIIAIECFDKEFIENLLKLGIPVCFHDFAHTSQQLPYNYDIVFTNDEQSITSIVKELNENYQVNRFTFVGDNKHCHSFRKRQVGMILGLMHLKVNPTTIQNINISEEIFDYSNPNDIKEEISKLKKLPEVFICCNDFVARNVCIALKSLNIKVPEDTMVVGFDNASESYSLSPTLTTFTIDKLHLGIEIVKTLIDRIENQDIPSRVITISTTLIKRESTTR